MAITWSDVTAIAPDASTASAGTQAAILASVAAQVAPAQWGALYTSGAAYLAAHLATLSRMRGRGPVTSETVDHLSRAYGAMMTAGELGLTSYGVEYQRLRRLLGLGLGVVP